MRNFRFSTVLLFGFFFIVFFAGKIFAKESTSPDPGIQSRYDACLQKLSENDFSGAISLLEHLINDKPDFSPAYRKLAGAFIFQGELEPGKSFFQNLIKENSSNGYAFYGLAKINAFQKNYDSAIRNYKNCIRLNSDFSSAIADGFQDGLVFAFSVTDSIETSIKYFSSLSQSDAGNANYCLGLGVSFLRAAEYEKAIDNFKKALKLNPHLLDVYVYLIAAHRMKSDYGSALKASKIFLEKTKSEKDLELLPRALSVTGTIYFFLGNYHKSLSLKNESYQLAIKVGDVNLEAISLKDVGGIFAFLGQPAKGLEYLEKAAALFKKNGNSSLETITIYNIGLAHKDLTNNNLALTYFRKALEIANNSGHASLNRYIFSGMGEVFFDQKKYQMSRVYFFNALESARKVHDRGMIGYILRYLGSIYFEEGSLKNAVKMFEDALEIGQESNDVQIIWEARSGLGSALIKEGEQEKAILQFTKAIAIFDSIRQNLDIQSLNSAFLNDKYEAYPSLVRLLAGKGKLREAFKIAEGYKAKSLLSILANGQFLLSELLPDSTRAELKQVRSLIEKTHADLFEQRSKKTTNPEEILTLNQRLTDLELWKSSLFEWLKKNKSAYYQMTSGNSLRLEEIQEKILSPDQRIVEYVVGEDGISAFVISQDSLFYREISVSREEFQQHITDLSEMFRGRSSGGRAENQLFWNADLANFSLLGAYRLYQMLILPLEPFLKGASELIIVPDDLMFYLPFETMVYDTTGITNIFDFGHAKFLVEKYFISYASSVSVLNPKLHTDHKSSTPFFALANPDFSRFRRALKDTASHSINEPLRGIQLDPLPYSEAEVKGIRKIIHASRRQVHFGKQATETILKRDAGSARIIHLATHYFNNDVEPMYSEIILTPDEKQNQDGLLQTYEIFNLRLNADLVVLSSCNSALGALNRGEGMVGISRAFLYAGVGSMVISLWNVEDKASSMIMESFYKYLAQGAPQNKALAMAKLDYLRNAPGDLKDPFYWAPFILSGNWRPINFEKEGGTMDWRKYLLVFLVMLFSLWMLIRRSHLSHKIN